MKQIYRNLEDVKRVVGGYPIINGVAIDTVSGDTFLYAVWVNTGKDYYNTARVFRWLCTDKLGRGVFSQIEVLYIFVTHRGQYSGWIIARQYNFIMGMLMGYNTAGVIPDSDRQLLENATKLIFELGADE